MDSESMMGIIRSYERDKRFCLAIMQDIEREFSYIPQEGIELISDYLDMPEAQIYSMATFYKALSLTKKGEHTIRVCDGTACHIKGAMQVADELCRRLNISMGQTTPDGKFSLESVNCVGCCSIAPVIVIGDDFYGKVTPGKVDGILKRYGGNSDV